MSLRSTCNRSPQTLSICCVSQVWPGPVFCLKLRLCSANHRSGYWSNLPCDWPSTAWAYSEQETENGPSFCLLLRVSSDYAQPITGQVTEVTCPVIGRAQPELTLSKRQKTGPVLSLCHCQAACIVRIYPESDVLINTDNNHCLASTQTNANLMLIKSETIESWTIGVAFKWICFAGV